MKNRVLLAIAVSITLNAAATETFNAVKVFQVDIDSIYNFYIDTIGTTSGEVEFCFQTTTDKLIKTNIEGNILSTTNNPYKYYTVFDEDTLILNGCYIIKNKDTIAYASDTMCRLITASQSGIYVYFGGDIDSKGVSWSWQVQNVLANSYSERICFYSNPISGLLFYQDTLYALEPTYTNNSGNLYSFSIYNNGPKKSASVPIKQPVGIAGYRGKIYVFSNSNKTVYQLTGTYNTDDNTSVSAYLEDKAPIHYGLDGKEISPSSPGVHIVKYPNGSVNKTIIY